jgi:hypothetical protein
MVIDRVSEWISYRPGSKYGVPAPKREGLPGRSLQCFKAAPITLLCSVEWQRP